MDLRSRVATIVAVSVIPAVLLYGTENYPPVPPQPANPIQLLPVQRSSALLCASTPEHRHTVRMIIDGQSTSQQWWSWELLQEIPRQFPNADFKGSLMAITSFGADYLIQTAESDVYPLLPDLIVFQCYGPYGPGQEWERILREFRKRTTADVILIGNHPVVDWELAEPTDPARIHFDLDPVHDGQAWLNYIRTPALCGELGLCNPDNRSIWKRFLAANGLRPADLLQDSIHFNKRGSDLLKEILRPYLGAARLNPPIDPFNNSRVRTYPVGVDGLSWVHGQLRLPFVGNRVDVVAGGDSGGTCRVMVDGIPPTHWPSGTGHSRSSGWKGEVFFRPALLKVGTLVPLEEEVWTLTVTSVDAGNRKRFSFSVSGSSTGPDGAGNSYERFVSQSGRVVIETNSWNFVVIPPDSQLGTTITWRSRVRSLDSYLATPVLDPQRERAVNLFFDLPDGDHVLELTADDPEHPPSLAALRVYHPGGVMPGTERGVGSAPDLRYLVTENQLLVTWPSSVSGARPWVTSNPTVGWTSPAAPLGEYFGMRTWMTPLQSDLELIRLDVP
ncbi:MAG: hypothetical protein U1G08_04610 [Verrucomicrobiota bacterium]